MISYEEVQRLNNYVNDNIKVLPMPTVKSFEEDFTLKFNHESTKMEGNTYTLLEVKTLLQDGITIGGKELREQYEIVNNNKAYIFVNDILNKKLIFDENLIKDIHQIITENIMTGGIYRNCNVKISGASFVPVDWTYVRDEMKYFIVEYDNYAKTLNPLQLAAFVHAEFVRIHPFEDGNGRIARILLNFVLMNNNFRPILIKTDDKVRYYNALDIYGKNKSQGDIKALDDFYNFILELEYERLLEYKAEIDRIIKVGIPK